MQVWSHYSVCSAAQCLAYGYGELALKGAPHRHCEQLKDAASEDQGTQGGDVKTSLKHRHDVDKRIKVSEQLKKCHLGEGHIRHGTCFLSTKGIDHHPAQLLVLDRV